MHDRIWLIEAAHAFPPSTQFDGFDISAAQFPDRAWLPQNVRLQTLDIFKPIPEEYRGKYDVVRVALLVITVRGNDPSGLIEGLRGLLSKHLFRLCSIVLLGGGRLVFKQEYFLLTHIVREQSQEATFNGKKATSMLCDPCRPRTRP